MLLDLRQVLVCRETGFVLENGYAMDYHSKYCGHGKTIRGRILNLGCGNETFGTHRVDIAKTDTTTDVFDIEEGLLFDDDYFDAVYERNLLEHLRNPGFHLQEVFRVLKQGGRAILITDNAACLRYYVLRTHMGSYMGHRKYLRHNEDKHYALFTQEHLRNLFLSVGFSILDIRYVDTDFIPTFFLDRLMRLPHLFSYFFYPRICVEAEK